MRDSAIKASVSAAVVFLLLVAYILSGYPDVLEAPRPYGYAWQMPDRCFYSHDKGC